MGRPQSGIYRDKEGYWGVDKVYAGSRLRRRFGQDLGEAKDWLIRELEQLRQAKLFGARRKWTFDEAGAKYLLDHQDKVSLENDIYLLETLMPFIGKLTLDRIHDGTLAPYVAHRKARGLAHKTVNLGVALTRRILNLAARKWRDDGGRDRPAGPPPLAMLPRPRHHSDPPPITPAEATRPPA